MTDAFLYHLVGDEHHRGVLTTFRGRSWRSSLRECCQSAVLVENREGRLGVSSNGDAGNSGGLVYDDGRAQELEGVSLRLSVRWTTPKEPFGDVMLAVADTRVFRSVRGLLETRRTRPGCAVLVVSAPDEAKGWLG